MVSVLEPSTIIRVQSWDIRKAAPSRAEEIVGVLWPKTTGTFVRGHAEVVCVGPTDWLVIAAASAGEPLMQSLGEAFRDSTFRATDVSAALARIQLEGPNVRQLFSKACSLDLDLQAFAVGRSARTRFAGMPVVVRCLQPATFECIVSQSYREYLLSWLADAAVEYR